MFNMVITKRLDVYGKIGQKNPLFCVFSMRKNTEIEIVEKENTEKENTEKEIKEKEIAESTYEVVPLFVRRLCGCHTEDYDCVMREMGRPLSTCTCQR